MDTKFKILEKKRFWAGILLAQFLLFFLLSKMDIAVVFFQSFFERQKKFHQKLFSFPSFSLGDIFYIFTGIFIILILLKISKKPTRNKGIIQLLISLNIFYCLYQIFWGMLYFQEPLIKILDSKEPTLQEKKELAFKYLSKCKKDRKIVQEDKNGVFKIYHLEKIEKEILQNQKHLPAEFPHKKGTDIHSLKPSFFGKIMSYTGILGYYNPFSAEAQYNSNLPSTQIPFTLAHESSHQMGFAREQEANFIGYLIGKNSKNSELRYSTNYYVLKSLLKNIEKKDSLFVTKFIENYSTEMKRDRNYEKAFAAKHRGALNTFFGITNDLFLKSNQQDGSVTYSYFVDLLVRYERKNP